MLNWQVVMFFFNQLAPRTYNFIEKIGIDEFISFNK